MSEVQAPQSGELTIKGIAPVRQDKTYGTLTFAEYPGQTVLYGAQAEFLNLLAVGETHAAVLEAKPSPNGNISYWLRSWKGVAEKKAKQGGGGGGYAPKPPIEAWASLAGSCIETAAKVEHGKPMTEVVSTAKVLFGVGYEMVQAALAGRVNK